MLTISQSFSDKSDNQQARFPMKVFHQNTTVSEGVLHGRRSGKEC